MKPAQTAKYTSLKLLPNGLAEATAEAAVQLEGKRGVLDIGGLVEDLNPSSLRLSSSDAEIYLESVIEPFPLGERLPKGALVSVSTEKEAIEGKVVKEFHYRGSDNLILQLRDSGKLVTFPNAGKFLQVSMLEDYLTEPLLRLVYDQSRDAALGGAQEAKSAKITLSHHLGGISVGGIVYELLEKEAGLMVVPTLELNSTRSEAFEAVKLTIVAPAVTQPQGGSISPEISPVHSEVERSGRVTRYNNLPVPSAGASRRVAFRGAGPTLGCAEEADPMIEETPMWVDDVLTVGEVEDTLEGQAIALQGNYNLAPQEKRKLILDGTSTKAFQHAQVLMLNPSKYDSGMYYTTILESLRFTPEKELKAGSFFVDGMQLAFPAMKAGQEYELALRTCQNLYALITREDSQTQSARGNKKVTPGYTAVLVNDTNSPQEVEVNIPEAVVRKLGDFTPKDDTSYKTQEIVGEKCYVAKLTLEPKSKKTFGFELQK